MKHFFFVARSRLWVLVALVWAMGTFAPCSHAAEDAAALRAQNEATLFIGPQAQNGSFESGAFAPWRELVHGMGKIESAKSLGITAADGEQVFHYQIDLGDETQRKHGRMALDLSLADQGFSSEHALKFGWQQRGPRQGVGAMGPVEWSAQFFNGDKQVGAKDGNVAAPTGPEWQTVSVDLGQPPAEWDGKSLYLLLQSRPDTTNSGGKHEMLLDDFRLQSIPVAPWKADLAYYPSYNKLRLRADSYYKKPDAKATLNDAAGQTVWTKTLALTDGKLDQTLEIPPLDGQYVLHLDSGDGEHKLEYPLTRRKFEWENNTLGITDKVYAPFTPVTVTGRKVGVVGREYELDELGLFEQVTATGVPLLARPMRLLANGKPVEANAKFAQFSTEKPSMAVHRGGGVAGGVSVALRNIIEYDGAARLELTLAPMGKSGKLNSLELEIPLRDRNSPLWHVCRDFLRVNLAGKVPAGNGQIWKNLDFDVPNYYGGETAFYANFIPYIWLGDEERGLSWFADNDRNWGSDPTGKKPFLTLERKNGELILRVHLVQVPTTINEPRTLTFGLMASPAKPMPANWRDWIAGRVNHNWIGSEYFGGIGTFNAKYPVNHDYEILDLQQERRRLVNAGKPLPDPSPQIAEWGKRNLPDTLSDEISKRILGTTGPFINSASTKNQIVTSYFEEHNTNVSTPEAATFGWEWASEYQPWWSTYLREHAGKMPTNAQEFDLGTGYSAAPSQTDFAVWNAAQFIKRGVGIYFDNTFARNIRNPVTTTAYAAPHIKRVENTQPSAAIWAQREYHKRIWVLHQELAPPATPTAMMIHMTNANILPMLGFNEINLDLEWDDRVLPFQQKYRADLLRAETLGFHTGNIPTVLANTHGSDDDAHQNAMAMRTRTGGLLVHEARHAQDFRRYEPLVRQLRDFGYGTPQARVFRYWDANAPVQSPDDNVKWLLVKNGERLLLVLCSWNDKPTTAQLKLDLKALKVAAPTVSDPEFPDGKTPFVPSDLHPDHVQPNWIKRYYAPGAYELGYQGAPVWNAATGALRVPLTGYGVRVLVLK